MNWTSQITEIINEYGDSKTGDRILKVYREFTQGYNTEEIDRQIESGIFQVENYDQLVFIKAIPFSSMCKHHFLPFFGNVSIVYFPSKIILGLSKFPRIVYWFSRRFQLQEEFTIDVANYIYEKVKSPVAVFVKAVHTCMVVRGIRSNGEMETQYFVGNWSEGLKQEVLQKIGKGGE